MVTAHAVAVPLAATLMLGVVGSAPAEARIIQGDYLRLQAEGEAGQMQNLAPGEPVAWDVGVWADAPDPGEIRLSISGQGDLFEIDDGVLVSVRSCPVRWEGASCEPGAEELLDSVDLLDAPAANGTRALTTMPSDEERWLRTTVTLNPAAGGRELAGATGSVRIRAVGAGEEVSTGGGDGDGGGSQPADDTTGEDPAGGAAGSADDGSPGGTTGEPDADSAAGDEGEASAAPAPGDGFLARTGAPGMMQLLAVGALLLGVGAAVRGLVRRSRSV